ncbi:MAG: aminotransferase class I/II-fold pyridoxal phosphate-dependent enzyme [Actinomycetes bacterium]
MDQSRAPVLDAITEFRRRGDVIYGPPGHKQGRGVDPRVLEVLGDKAFASDMLMLNGLDDRAMSQGILTDAEDLMADAVRADKAFFSTCGSSLSVKAAMLAVAGPHEKLAIIRNSHKSVSAGLVLSGIEPVWIYPRWDASLQVAHPPRADDVARVLDAAPDVKGVLVVSPTDYGTCAELRQMAAVCHERERPLIVDEAWACHFPFHNGLPTWAMDAGADLCVTSIHKSGSGFEQSSVYHLQGKRVDADVLAARGDLFSTTSPSSLLYAAIDGWRRQMVEEGEQLLGSAIQTTADFVKQACDIEGLDIDIDAWRGADGVAELDPLKVCIDVWRLGLSGYDAAGWLRNEHRVNVGVSDHRRIAVMFTHADDDQTVGKLLFALRSLAESHDIRDEPLETTKIPAPGELDNELALLPRDAFFAATEQVKAKEAVGRICAELITPYPPGIPAVMPGERITEAHLDYLRSGVEHGMYIPDAFDQSVKTLRVVA